MAMARCIMENGRRDILYTYPTALYEGEQVEKKYASKYPRVFKRALSVELLEEHQAFFEGCRKLGEKTNENIQAVNTGTTYDNRQCKAGNAV